MTTVTAPNPEGSGPSRHVGCAFPWRPIRGRRDGPPVGVVEAVLAHCGLRAESGATVNCPRAEAVSGAPPHPPVRCRELLPGASAINCCYPALISF